MTTAKFVVHDTTFGVHTDVYRDGVKVECAYRVSSTPCPPIDPILVDRAYGSIDLPPPNGYTVEVEFFHGGDAISFHADEVIVEDGRCK